MKDLGHYLNEDINEGRKIKPFKKVKYGDEGTDTTGEAFIVVAKGTAQEMVDGDYDEGGMTEEGIKDGYIDPNEDAIAVEMPNKKGFRGTVAWTYDEGGAVVYESVVNEKMIDVTKDMWEKMSDEEQEDALLSAASDPDATEKFIGFKYDKLPSWVKQNMAIDESVVNESLKSFDAVKISSEILKQKSPVAEFTQLITDILEQVYDNADSTETVIDMVDDAIESLTKLSKDLENM